MADDTDETPRILIADDDSDIRAVLSKMVEPLGANLIEAEDGRQALTILKKQRVDVIICDLMMPRMSGMMLLHSLLEQGFHVPFILVTGYSDKDSAIQALRLGAFDYLEKPLHASDLQPVVVEALKLSAQQRILRRVVESQGMHNTLGSTDHLAEFQIMKMRTFRATDTSPAPLQHDAAEGWDDLKDLFLQEARPQLIFSESATRDLAASPNVAHGLAFVLRLVQSIRLAAESIRLTDVSAFTWSLEAMVSGLRRQPASLNPEHVTLMIEAHHVIGRMLEQLGDPRTLAIRGRIQAVEEALRAQSGPSQQRKKAS